MHFVDDEIFLALQAARPDAKDVVEALVRLLIVVSPEPPLFPLSAKHELPQIASLLDDLAPFLDRGFLNVTGAGASPSAYLNRRRRQFEWDLASAGSLFSRAEDIAIERYGPVWIAKTGDSTAAIARNWEANMLADRGGVISVVRKRRGSITEDTLGRILGIPETIGGRPLLPDVVLAELAAHRLLVAPDDWVRDDLAQFLGSEWARVYATDLDAMILRDLGAGLPNIRTFLPRGVSTLSARRAQDALRRLEMTQALSQMSNEALSHLLSEFRTVHIDVADDIFDRAVPSSAPLWAPWERAGLRQYDQLMRRRTFALAFPLVSAHGLDAAASDLARRFETYSRILDSPNLNYGGRPVSIDKSINIGVVHGDAQIASGDNAVLNAVATHPTQVPELLARRLVAAASSELAMDEFTGLVVALGDPAGVAPEQVKVAVQEAVSRAEIAEPAGRRLRAIAGDLSLRVGGGVIAGAILAGLKAAGF